MGDPASFLEHHWARSPLHLPGDDATAFADLFTLDDVDHLVASSFARAPTFRLVRNGTPVPPARYTKTARVGGNDVAGVGDPRRVFQEFADGATIVLQGLQRYWPPITDLCRQLELELNFPVQANAYVTPPGSQGLAVHYDTHDVFVLQVGGSKEWEVYDPVFPDPLPAQPWAARRQEPGPVTLSVRLETGDFLYVPRGFLHSARAQADLSAHLTIGIHAETRHDVLRHVVEGAAETAGFRRSLPPGWASDEERLAKEVEMAIADLRSWLDGVDARAVAADTVQRFWAGRAPILPGQLASLLGLPALGDRTMVHRRPDAVCHLRLADDAVHLGLGQRELRMPAVLEPVLRRIAATTEPFAVGDLADVMDEDSRQVLARRLVREGLLRIVPDA
ncbi:MAG: JmjC domain-containing protein [Acidimicrobiia bacterium]